MKKYTRLFSSLALILALTFIFSGCGIVDYAKSILKKNDEAPVVSAENSEPANDGVYNNTVVTDSAVIAPYTEEDTTASASLSTSSTSSESSTVQSSVQATTQANAQTTASSSKKDDTTAVTSSTAVTTADKKPVTNNKTDKPQTTVGTTAPITEEEIEQMPVKEIQDMLFATTDPNTAGKILNACGFEYDAKQGIYYSTMEPLQRLFGYNFIYDMAAPRVGMIYSTERIKFKYGGKDWMIQLWKGQYGITAGAEIGLYNKTDKIMHYECASNDELIEMAFDFYNQGEYVFSRGPEKHWWLTGFKIFNTGIGILIDLDITLTFPNVEMANAFETGLKKTVKNAILDPITYKRTAKTFKIHW